MNRSEVSWAPPPSAPAGRDIEFSRTDFERVRSLIRARAGIDLAPGKQGMVYGRMARILRERGFSSFAPYLDSLHSGDAQQWEEFVNCLTTNLTSFYREAHHFPVLAAHLRTLASPPRIWCAAASTGEEAWSIAITVDETVSPAAGSGRPVISATDIDTQVLATARAGEYPAEAVAGIDQARLRKYFLKGAGANSGRVRVKPALGAMVEFSAFNLLQPAWQLQPHDAVFCRNVLIYFDRATQRGVLERMHGCLKPGALLFVGHSENFTDHRDLFEFAGKTVYRRAGRA